MFMGLWRCTFGTWVLCSFCMFLHVQRTWVPPGLAYRGSGFSKASAPSLRAWRSARRSLRLGVGGLMAGGRGFASHGSVPLSQGWLCQK